MPRRSRSAGRGRRYRSWSRTTASRCAASYRGEPVPLADRQDDGPDAAFSPTTEPVDDSQDASSNTVTLSYYVSASLPGEFVSESAYITPHAEGVSAKTQRSEIIIE